ncbi:MAG: carboxylating nicotinate-nucleotide diphosphorylase [Candidatus Thermoplasmatota archaeon]
MDDIERFLLEDLGEEGDITSDALFSNEIAEAIILAKEDNIVAGLEEATNIYKRLNVEMNTMYKDGEQVKNYSIVSNIKGPIRGILKGERLVLNIISRMSGIATETRELVNICRRINPKIEIAATRKTTPGFRYYEKKAVMIGGGKPHRFGLYDAVIIKDNHLRAYGSVEEAIKKIKEKIKNKTIEIEVESEKDAIIAARLHVDVIMLDNVPAKTAEHIANKIRSIDDNIIIEVSGGINKRNIKKYARFADRISLGYITHSVKSKDYSLEIVKPF